MRGYFYDHCTAASASLAFYGLFSGFPLLLLSVTVAAVVLDADRAADRVQEVLRAWVPISSGLVEAGVRGAVDAGGGVFGFSIIALLWSGTRVFAQVTRALNEAWDVPHNYTLRYRLVIEPFLVMVTVALIALSLLYKPVLNQVWDSLTGKPTPPEGPVWSFAGEVWVKVLGFLIVLLLYRYLPRRRVSWRDAVPGALLTSVFFQVSQEAFERYIERYDVTIHACVRSTEFHRGPVVVGIHQRRDLFTWGGVRGGALQPTRGPRRPRRGRTSRGQADSGSDRAHGSVSWRMSADDWPSTGRNRVWEQAP